MSEQYRLKKGDQVRIRLAGTADEWVRGCVVLASETNPSSVGLIVDGGLRSKSGAWIGGGMPLTIDYDAQTVTSLIGDEYEIDVASMQATYSEPDEQV